MYKFAIILFLFVSCSNDRPESNKEALIINDSLNIGVNNTYGKVQMNISKKVSDQILSIILDSRYSDNKHNSLKCNEKESSFSYFFNVNNDSCCLNITRLNGEISFVSASSHAKLIELDSQMAIWIGKIYLKEFFGNQLNPNLDFSSFLSPKGYWQVGQVKDKSKRDKNKCGGGSSYVNLNKTGGAVLFIGASK